MCPQSHLCGWSHEGFDVIPTTGAPFEDSSDEEQDQHPEKEDTAEEKIVEKSDIASPCTADVKQETESEGQEMSPEQPDAESSEEGPRGESAVGCGCVKAFGRWRPSAGPTASVLAAMAVTLFSASTSVLDTEETLWEVCFGIVVVLLLGAAVAAVVFIRDSYFGDDNEGQCDDHVLDDGVPL